MSIRQPRRPTYLALAAAAGLSLAGYPMAVRPWLLRWGATAAKARRPMPGDGAAPHRGAVLAAVAGHDRAGAG